MAKVLTVRTRANNDVCKLDWTQENINTVVQSLLVTIINSIFDGKKIEEKDP